MYHIYSSQDTFMKEYGIPEGVEITNIPYDGTPFSAYTTLSYKGKTLDVQFGVGGYYADVAMEYIKDFFEEERIQELADWQRQEIEQWELEYAESEDYNNLSYEERMAEEDAVDRYLDGQEDREQDMLEAQWYKAEQPPTTVTAIIRDKGQLLYVMGSDGEWVLPWGPIIAHGDNDHELYTPHEMDSMKSLADMLLSTLGVRIASCQWVSTGIYRTNGDDYEVTLVDYPVVDGVTVKWQDSEALQLP